jgi:hypothetical protein
MDVYWVDMKFLVRKVIKIYISINIIRVKIYTYDFKIF